MGITQTSEDPSGRERWKVGKFAVSVELRPPPPPAFKDSCAHGSWVWDKASPRKQNSKNLQLRKELPTPQHHTCLIVIFTMFLRISPLQQLGSLLSASTRKGMWPTLYPTPTGGNICSQPTSKCIRRPHPSPTNQQVYQKTPSFPNQSAGQQVYGKISPSTPLSLGYKNRHNYAPRVGSP